ncbi:MAG: hypothetical protein ACYCXF_06025 [Thermoleophilia bacterium]
MQPRPPDPLGTRLLIILAITSIIVFSGMLVLAARSCGGDEPAPVSGRRMETALFQAAGDDIVHHVWISQG